ncbi:hypothetical protein DVH24_008338 [Malus domestica]|uniref:Uncharacterized protein n=1 Tax=Malus domestica TaxID=3750 RepID=A0A498JJF9_MALDO|nr:hypothetical protein DVH24_008338 [Malus domestica]
MYNDGFFERGFMTLFARKMMKSAAPGRSRSQQQKVVREVLLSMLPPGAPEQKLFQPTKWAAEFNAALTVPFFHWLVGPSEIPGEQWAADFEDRNCEMVYGKVPPPFEEDPVSKEPCFTELSAGTMQAVDGAEI